MDEIPFDEWLTRVDAILIDRIGVASDCLPDCPYAEWHEAGATPKKAAALAVRRIDGPRDSDPDEPVPQPPARPRGQIPTGEPAVNPLPQTKDEIQAALTDPFPPDVVKWKPQTVKDQRAMAVAYIDPRAVMKRLDNVFGFGGWETSFRDAPGGNVVCTLRVRSSPPGSVPETWVQREGIGTPSGQPDAGDKAKAAFSEALKLAAVQLGIGRYLYELPKQWVGFDPQKKQLTERPQLPAWAIPDDFKPAGAKMGETVHKLAISYCNESKRNLADYVGGLLVQLGYKDVKTTAAQIQLRHAKALMRKINADIEEFATGKLPDGYPTTGPELFERVSKKDAELAKAHPKHVGVGALLAAVVAAGVKNGFGNDLKAWSGNKAMRCGFDAVAAFLAETNLKTGQTKPTDPPPQQQNHASYGNTPTAPPDGDAAGDDYGGDGYGGYEEP